MIVKSYEVGKIDISKYKIYLFYGKNEGLQIDLIDKYFLNKFKGQINKYEENEFINNINNIYSEIQTKSLFQNQRIFIISRITEKFLKIAEEISNIDLNEIIIILKCSSLDKKSRLRNFFEKNDKFITIPVYEDNLNNLLSITQQFLIHNKIKLSKESINLIIGRASGDRNNLKKELNKIYNYSLSNNKIDFQTLEKLTNLAENHEVSDLVNNYLSKNIKKVSKILNENSYRDEDCILILRTLLNKSKRLLEIMKKNNDVKNIDKVMLGARPPIFWKEKESIKKQVNSWEICDLKDKIYKINEIEASIKKNSRNSLNIVSDFLVNF